MRRNQGRASQVHLAADRWNLGASLHCRFSWINHMHFVRNNAHPLTVLGEPIFQAEATVPVACIPRRWLVLVKHFHRRFVHDSLPTIRIGKLVAQDLTQLKQKPVVVE